MADESHNATGISEATPCKAPWDFDRAVRADDARPAGREGECYFCETPMGGEHLPDCVVLDIRSLDAAPVGQWLPIETYRPGGFVLFWFPHGETGAGGMESAMAWPDDDGMIRVGWSHGGPNNGVEFDFPEPPTKWARLPDRPGFDR